MEFRSALPTALLLGGAIGAALATTGTRKLVPTPEILDLAASASVVEEPAIRWDIPFVWNESVERFVRLFEREQQDRMALYLKRSGRYEGMIRSKLRERGMPEDLIYLSMIESGFNPNAKSKAQAVGLWQFIAPTGRNYGLRVDGYVDERRDPEKSTDAALRYLQDLYRQFGSWNLAAAAYNTGENRVARIMREETGSERGKEEDFWRIRSRLPRDTREYVPLMFAMAMIGKEPQKYGLEGVERWLPLETDTVQVPARTDLGVVARAVGVDEEAIRTLNPHLVRGMTPPGEAFPVRIPEGRAAVFAAHFPRVQSESHPQSASKAKAGASKAKTSATKAKTSKAGTAERHRVRKGESLWTIARRHGVSVSALQRANGMGKRTGIKPGQVLRVPA